MKRISKPTDTYFVLKRNEFKNSEFALGDFDGLGLDLSIDFYQYDFLKKLLIDFGSSEYVEFLNFQLSNSKKNQGLVYFLIDELSNAKEIIDTEEEIELRGLMSEIMNKTDTKALFSIYNSEVLIDPEIVNSSCYFSKFLICHKNNVKSRIKEIEKILKKITKGFEFGGQEELIQEYEFDVEDLSTIGKKVILMKEIGVIDFLIEKYQEESNINQLANIIHCFTGLGSRSIQSILNPIYNASNNQKNNPYCNQKNLDQVKAKMAELHIKL